MSSRPSGYPQSFSEAEELLRGRPRLRLSGRETYLARTTNRMTQETEYAVFFHSTPVVTFRASGVILVDSGEWATNTTKERIRACGINVYVKKHVWYIGNKVFHHDAPNVVQKEVKP